MNAKQVGLWVVLVSFLAFTAYALFEHGYIGFFEAVLASTAGVQAFVDLVIALSLIMMWMWNDAREHGISPVLYIVLTLTLGSIGPLLYLIRRTSREHSHPLPLSAQEGRLS
jgi:Terpene cyclase DEP1